MGALRRRRRLRPSSSISLSATETRGSQLNWCGVAWATLFVMVRPSHCASSFVAIASCAERPRELHFDRSSGANTREPLAVETLNFRLISLFAYSATSPPASRAARQVHHSASRQSLAQLAGRTQCVASLIVASGCMKIVLLLANLAGDLRSTQHDTAHLVRVHRVPLVKKLCLFGPSCPRQRRHKHDVRSRPSSGVAFFLSLNLALATMT